MKRSNLPFQFRPGGKVVQQIKQKMLHVLRRIGLLIAANKLDLQWAVLRSKVEQCSVLPETPRLSAPADCAHARRIRAQLPFVPTGTVERRRRRSSRVVASSMPSSGVGK